MIFDRLPILVRAMIFAVMMTGGFILVYLFLLAVWAVDMGLCPKSRWDHRFRKRLRCSDGIRAGVHGFASIAITIALPSCPCNSADFGPDSSGQPAVERQSPSMYPTSDAGPGQSSSGDHCRDGAAAPLVAVLRLV